MTSLSELISRVRRRRAIRCYVKRLGQDLSNSFGASDSYSYGQIMKAVERTGVGQKQLAYAFALFRSEVTEEIFNRHKVDQSFLIMLRKELAEELFDGKLAYNAQDVVRLGAGREWKGGRNETDYFN